LVPASEALKPGDFCEKSEAGTRGTKGTTHNEGGAAEPEPPAHADPAALAHADSDHDRGDRGDDRQRADHRRRASVLIERCHAAGVRLRLASDGLRVGRAIAEHPDLADALRAHRYDVLVELRAQAGLCFVCGAPAPAVSTMPSGEPVHMDCLDAAVAATDTNGERRL
jgi:hypothetical protein